MISTLARWVIYYSVALVATVVLAWPSSVSAHGEGCCSDPCTVGLGCSCGGWCKEPVEEGGYVWTEACPHCFVGICWQYEEYPTQTCEWICCNDDISHCDG